MNAIEKVLELAGSRAFEEISLAWGVGDEVEKLKRTISIIKAVLLDAEAKQATNPSLREWLDQLKNAFYDAEDILDEFEVEDDKRKFVKAGGIARKVPHFFSPSNPIVFRPKMAHKLKSINEKLDKITAEKEQFGLVEREENRRLVSGKRDVAHLFMHVPDIIGRDRDKEIVVEFLLHFGHAAGGIPVIPVVGIGGSGKTAFAKLVCEDKRVDGHFELKMWVTVSVDFDLRILAEKIIKSATKDTVSGETYSHWGTEDLLRLLREKIADKKYLLVFDDVWNDDPVEWNQLKGLLSIGADGSKIMVTTRSDRVASAVGTVTAYPLPGLPHGECMSVFVKAAFKGGWQEAARHRKLREIGEHIVTKCGGVPLAIITLGAMLSSTRSVREWELIRDSEMWELDQNENHILPSLRLSYEQLTPQLKRCFVCCAAFPKDHVFFDTDLIPFWMALGLLRSSHPNQDLEDVGLHYMKELESRCFFQDFEEFEGYITYKMHDLVHDLALSVAENEFFTVTGRRQVPKNARHLAFLDPELPPEDLSSSLQNLDRVRSFGTFEIHHEGISQSLILACLSRFKYLRMLDLMNSQFEALPRSICRLKHLRFLRLTGNRLIKKLPSYICKLYSLQTLAFCYCLRMEELPRDLRYMISLRVLAFSTKQKVFPMGGLGRLRSLRDLAIYGCENLEYLCEDVKDLSCLRRLYIRNCKRLISLPEGIKYLTALEILSIGGCRNLKELPGCLQHLTHLQQLWISDCPQLRARCQPETGEDWPKIKHIPRVYIERENIISGDGSDDSEESVSPGVPE